MQPGVTLSSREHYKERKGTFYRFDRIGYNCRRYSLCCNGKSNWNLFSITLAQNTRSCYRPSRLAANLIGALLIEHSGSKHVHEWFVSLISRRDNLQDLPCSTGLFRHAQPLLYRDFRFRNATLRSTLFPCIRNSLIERISGRF
jgi:hypothetical protein